MDNLLLVNLFDQPIGTASKMEALRKHCCIELSLYLLCTMGRCLSKNGRLINIIHPIFGATPAVPIRVITKTSKMLYIAV